MERALELDPNDHKIVSLMGEVRQEGGEPRSTSSQILLFSYGEGAEAEKLLLRALELRPEHAASLCLLGILYWKGAPLSASVTCQERGGEGGDVTGCAAPGQAFMPDLNRAEDYFRRALKSVRRGGGGVEWRVIEVRRTRASPSL